MTRHRRHQHLATVGAVVLAAAAVGAGLHGLYPHAVVLGLGVLTLTEAALRQRRLHRRVVREHDWARLHGVGERPQPLWPCCLIAQASDDNAHSPHCTRAVDPQQFWDIVARLDGN